MCIAFIAIQQHPDFKLMIAANRDEFYDRPTAPADYWSDYPVILAGRDLQSGGTWCGVTRAGRFALLTNFHDPASYNKNAPSRGTLVATFLSGDTPPQKFARSLQSQPSLYNGYSLLLGDATTILVTSNRSPEIRELTSGLFGLSNHLLETPWPKVVRGKQLFSQLLRTQKNVDNEKIFELMRNHDTPRDPIFVTSPTYGTRTTTVISMSSDDTFTFRERTFTPHARATWTERSFTVEAP